MPPKSKIVKVGPVSLVVNEWRNSRGKIDYRFTYKDKNRKRKDVTRAKQADAIAAAKAVARKIHNGNADLGDLSDDKARIVRAFLELEPTWQDVERFREMKQRVSATVSQASQEFIDLKIANRGRSNENIRTLKGHLKKINKTFSTRYIDSISVVELDGWLTSQELEPRSKKNLRAGTVTFFRWCKTRGYLSDSTTAAEKMAKPIVPKKRHKTYTPDEMRLMVENVRPQYLPWLVLAGYQCVRQVELYPDTQSTKGALDWSDIDFERMLIMVPPEVDKNGIGRALPMREITKTLLQPIAKKSGRITDKLRPDKARKKNPTETANLGDLVGGWRINGLRKSAISYGCALDGVGLTAMHAGNSESTIKAEYLNAKGADEALDYFGELSENSA